MTRSGGVVKRLRKLARNKKVRRCIIASALAAQAAAVSVLTLIGNSYFSHKAASRWRENDKSFRVESPATANQVTLAGFDSSYIKSAFQYEVTIQNIGAEAATAVTAYFSAPHGLHLDFLEARAIPRSLEQDIECRPQRRPDEWSCTIALLNKNDMVVFRFGAWSSSNYIPTLTTLKADVRAKDWKISNFEDRGVLDDTLLWDQAGYESCRTAGIATASAVISTIVPLRAGGYPVGGVDPYVVPGIVDTWTNSGAMRAVTSLENGRSELMETAASTWPSGSWRAEMPTAPAVLPSRRLEIDYALGATKPLDAADALEAGTAGEPEVFTGIDGVPLRIAIDDANVGSVWVTSSIASHDDDRKALDCLPLLAMIVKGNGSTVLRVTGQVMPAGMSTQWSVGLNRSGSDDFRQF